MGTELEAFIDEDSEIAVIDQKQTQLDFGEMSLLISNDKKGKLRSLISSKILTSSALFTTRNNKQPRLHFKDQELFVAKDIGEIRYRGEELRFIDDNRVFQTIIEMARVQRAHETDYTVRTTAYMLIKQIGWPNNGKKYHQLKDCLERLKATAITATTFGSGNTIKSISLIAKFVIHEKDKSGNESSLEITLDPEILKLFQKDDAALLPSKMYDQLSVLAQKSFSIIKSLDQETQLSVEDYMRATGNNYKVIRQFKAKLKTALEELQRMGYISSWDIDKNGTVSATPCL